MPRQRAARQAPRAAVLTTILAVLYLLAFGAGLALPREQGWTVVSGAAIVPQWLLGDLQRPAELDLVPLWLTPLSAVFIQPGFVLLSFNLFWIVALGPRLERTLGSARLAILLLLCAYGSAFFQAISIRDTTAIVGAGGVAGSMMGAFLMLHPKRLLRLRVAGLLTLPLPAILLIVSCFSLDLMLALRDIAGGKPLEVAYPLHLAGFLLGAGTAAVLRPAGMPLFDKGKAWFSLDEWDEDAAAAGKRTLAVLAAPVLAGIYIAIAAAAIASGRF